MHDPSPASPPTTFWVLRSPFCQEYEDGFAEKTREYHYGRSPELNLLSVLTMFEILGRFPDRQAHNKWVLNYDLFRDSPASSRAEAHDMS